MVRTPAGLRRFHPNRRCVTLPAAVPHGNDITRWFLGSEAVRAYSQWTSFSGFVPGESSMTLYTWASGVLSDYWMSYELPNPVFQQNPFDPMNPIDPLRLRAYAAQLEDLVAAIAARRDPYVSGREGLNTTQMLEGADRSSKLNQAVELPLG